MRREQVHNGHIENNKCQLEFESSGIGRQRPSTWMYIRRGLSGQSRTASVAIDRDDRLLYFALEPVSRLAADRRLVTQSGTSMRS
jgi:hypothetical protein